MIVIQQLVCVVMSSSSSCTTISSPRLEGESMEVNVFRYLGVDVSVDGSMKDEVNHRIDEGKRANKMNSVLKAVNFNVEPYWPGISRPTPLLNC
ncbi:uncharacterized protein [Cherax quadricarinatus]|uniref:uncharacterized protein isoform X2 n=1 Tax=Cherax quadricarinatus TaxID=27406 RepID=UPI00387ED172